MSNLRSPCSARALLPNVVVWPCLCAAVIAGVRGVRADDARSPFEALAEFVTAPPDYRGPTVPFPDAPPRPADTGWVACSADAPLCVHAPPEVSEARVERALAALEGAHAWLAADGWPLPYPDGTRGGGVEFDVYLERGAIHPARAAADAPLDTSPLDGAFTHAFLDAELPDAEFEPCAASALAQAGLLARDPAEPDDVRRTFAAFATWRWTSQPGCYASFEDAQAAPELGVLGDTDAQSAAGALWLAMISRRHDRGTGRFVRGAVELARQRSRSPNALHARPTIVQALAAMLEQTGESLDDSAAEFAIARYFAPFAEGALPRLPRAARIDARWAPPFAKLPRHLPVHEPALATYGSGYARVDTAGATEGAQLEIWLRGEHGARWSLAAVQLDGMGRELGRIAAPARKVPDSFLPVVLEANTAEVLLVVTKLPSGALPDPRLARENDAHHFRLILGRR